VEPGVTPQALEVRTEIDKLGAANPGGKCGWELALVHNAGSDS
jgi:hypothetical protein